MHQSRMPRVVGLLGLLVLLAAAGVAGAGGPSDALVVGVPYEDTTDMDVGAVAWIWTSSLGLVADSDGLLTGDLVSGASGNAWGMVLATGDFNGDRRPDLVVGAPYADLGDPVVADAGMVSVCLRTHDASGSMWSCTTFALGVGGVPGTAESGDRFGASLAVGDFNADGFDDVAVGAPYGSVSGVAGAGAVNVLYGGLDGVSGVGQPFAQGAGGVMAGLPEEMDRFGWALASGDFNGDGYADLAVGVPGEESLAGVEPESGAVHMIYGSATGLTTAGNAVWPQGGLIGAAEDEAYDSFGFSLAAGDVNDDGFDDLAIGIPGEDLLTSDEGMVAVLAGGTTGIDPASRLLALLHQDLEHVPDTNELGDQFGFALTMGDFDGDGRADLAVGTPFEDSTVADVGAVTVFYGSPAGYCLSNTQLWQQGGELGDAQEEGDQFGQVLAAGDFNDDGRDDLAVGAPREDLATVDAGVVHVIYGADDAGLGADGAQIWSQDTSDIDDSCETGDQFGYSLVAIATTEVFHDGFELGTLDPWSSYQ